MTEKEIERNNVKAVADAARSFLKCYDEFEDQPECCGQYLEALVDSVIELTGEEE